MPAPTFPSLFGSTVARKWVFDVNTGTIASPVWVTIGGINSVDPTQDAPNFEDDSDMQSGGAGSQTKTAGAASITLTCIRKVKSDGISYDVGQEYLRSKAINTYGPANSVQIRMSEYTPGPTPRVEAYVGMFAVGWDPQGGSNTALDTVQVSLMGQGQFAAIAHPYLNTAIVPTVTSTNPGTLATAGGTLVRIFGSAFTGVTAVSIAGNVVPTSAWSFDNDGQITAVAPAHAAGSGLPVVVTNGTGASSGGATVVYA